MESSPAKRDADEEGGTSGNYSLVDGLHGWNAENDILIFGARRHHCFAGYLDSETTFSALDAIEVGQRVRVDLQPAVPHAAGRQRLGPRYERHPRLRRTDFALRDRRARGALKDIGCPAAGLR